MPHSRGIAGHVVAFSGRLLTMTRKQAGALVLRAGGRIDDDLSPRTTLVVLGAATAVTGDAQEAASRDATAGAAGVETLTEEEFCAFLGRVPPSALRQHYYPWRAIRARYAAVRDDHLRYLEKWGLLRSVVRTPSDTYYGFADLAVIKQAHAELEHGASFRAVVRSLAATRDGQLTLDFRAGAASGPPPQVVALAPRASRPRPEARDGRDDDSARSLAEARFVEGERLEAAEGDPTEAMHAYRQALALDPLLVPAMINLGNLHYALDHLAEAQALYLQAALVDPGCVEAHFNLGNVHHDRGRFAQAVLCYEEALRLDPDFADAHFYLAVTLEKVGRSAEARPHWRRYRQLAPEGEWVGLAEEFSDDATEPAGPEPRLT